MNAGRFTAIWAVWAMLLGGCGLATRDEIAQRPHRLRERPIAAATDGVSVDGRTLQHSVYGDGGETVLILGGVHGDEPAGTTLAKQLCAYLGSRADVSFNRRVVVAPATNPDGLARGQRTNARRVDLNRNFATRNWAGATQHGPKAMSEPETRFIADLILCYRPARIVTIHQRMNCVDWDGPARELAETMSRACGLPVKKLGARAGSLGSYAGVERRIPTITLELPGGGDDLDGDAIWKRYGPAVLSAITFSEVAK